MIILKNCNAVNFYPAEIINNVDIVIDNNVIINVAQNASTNYKAETEIDLSGKYVSPGLVCAHNHLYSMLSRGITASIRPSNDFISILKNLWWKLDRSLDEEAVYYSGITGAIEAIKSGCTSVFDHHSSPLFIKGSLNTLRQYFFKTGLRGVLAYEISDRDGIKKMMESVRESIEFINSVNEQKGSTVEAAIGAHASFTLSDNSLSLISDALNNTDKGLHIHAGEDAFDTSHSHFTHSKDIIKRFDDFNLINNKTIIAHGVHLTKDDVEIINRHDAFIVHNPRSNMNNNVGYLNHLNSINNVGLGTDGIGSDMLEELKFAYFRNKESNYKLRDEDFLRLLHSGNILLNRYFHNKFGKVAKDFIADLVVWDYPSPTPFTSENITGHLVYGFSSKYVESVIINGEFVYKNRELPFEINGIYQEAQKAAINLWQRIDKL